MDEFCAFFLFKATRCLLQNDNFNDCQSSNVLGYLVAKVHWLERDG